VSEQGRIVIIGAGHAGGTAAALLRQVGWTGSITLVGEETLPPYQRPPLSKAWLKGEADAESLLLKPDSFYPDKAITLLLNRQVTELDRGGKKVLLSDGSALAYDKLILATGARPRRLSIPGADLAGVLELRGAADADRLKARLGPGRKLAIIGAGYVGLEVAASARALGAEAVVIEREPRLLARVACPVLSDFFLGLHQRRGVGFELAAGVVSLDSSDGIQVEGVRLADGRLIACDTALVGIGAEPNCDLALAAGLACGGGIIVDGAARTEDPDIYAIGDCTMRPVPLYGCSVRLESVPNALEQAKQAVADLCGSTPPAPEVPWFWSDQYDVKLQIAGLPIGAVAMSLRGDPAANRFAIFHLDADNRILAVEAINAVPEFMAGRQLIASRQPVSPAKLADLSVAMKDQTAS